MQQQNVDDQIRLLDVHLANLIATAQASRIRLSVLSSGYAALSSNYAALSSDYAALSSNYAALEQLHQSYTNYVEELQKDKWNTIAQLRQSSSREFQLQAKLQFERATLRRSGQRRQRRSCERRKSC